MASLTVAGKTMWKLRAKRSDKPVEDVNPEVSHIGQSILIKGGITGGGNVYVAGKVEGNVELCDGILTVGPEGHIHGDVQAPSILLHGRVEGNLVGMMHVDLRASAVFVGDIRAPHIAVEGAASLTKKVQSQKDIPDLLTRKAG